VHTSFILGTGAGALAIASPIAFSGLSWAAVSSLSSSVQAWFALMVASFAVGQSTLLLCSQRRHLQNEGSLGEQPSTNC
jgi:cobalamin synthase